MTVPKNIVNLMNRAKYNKNLSRVGFEINYTLVIYKKTFNQHIDTFKKEIDGLKKWIEEIGGTCKIFDFPAKTKYNTQSCIVKISHAKMELLRSYINDTILVEKFGSWVNN